MKTLLIGVLLRGFHRCSWGGIFGCLVFLGWGAIPALATGISIIINRTVSGNSSDRGGWYESIYVTPDEFVLTIQPCPRRRASYHDVCSYHASYNEFSGPDLKALRVVGYQESTAPAEIDGNMRFQVHIPRAYKKLYIRGINGFGHDKILDLMPYDRYVKARRGGPEIQDSVKPELELTEPRIAGELYRTDELYVTLQGRATDNLALTGLQLNDETLPVRPNGQFKHRMRLKLGKNSVTLRATDVNDNVTMRSFMVLRDEIAPETQFSDVDFPVATSARTPQGIAVVIGIEDYRHAPNAPHAVNDAEIFREYLIKRFGYDRRNILLRLDEQATKGEFERIFGVNGWLERQVGPKSQVTVYYSGHGSPDIGSGTAFLVPHDIDPNYPSTGYALSDLYARLDALPAASATLVLDACFSGTSRTNEPLLADARPVALEVEEAPPEQDLVVLSAATGSQISSSADDRLHGLFTYYLLKGIQGDADANQDRVLTAGEVGNYVSAHVPSDARRMGREQTPVLHAADPARVLFRY